MLLAPHAPTVAADNDVVGHGDVLLHQDLVDLPAVQQLVLRGG